VESTPGDSPLQISQSSGGRRCPISLRKAGMKMLLGPQRRERVHTSHCYYLHRRSSRRSGFFEIQVKDRGCRVFMNYWRSRSNAVPAT
jgi:hypothetical protein